MASGNIVRGTCLGGARATILKGMCERRVLSPDGAGFYSVPKPRSFTRNVTQLVTYTRLDKANVGVRWWSAGGAEIEVGQILPPSDRSRSLAHLGCNGGCLEYDVQLSDGRG